MRVRVQLDLDVDVDAYRLAYGVEAGRIPSDVADYLVELAGYCSAANEGCWTVAEVHAWKGRRRAV